MSTTPELITEYFADFFGSDGDARPFLVQTWKRGWSPLPGAARIPVTWELVRDLQKEGVTSIAVAPLARPRQVADFTIVELVKHAERPIFGGRVI